MASALKAATLRVATLRAATLRSPTLVLMTLGVMTLGVAALLAGAVRAPAPPSGTPPSGAPVASTAAGHNRPHRAAVTLPAHRIVGPAILVSPRPVLRSSPMQAKGPAITSQPLGQTVQAGQRASFTATASGTPAPQAQWERSVNGGRTWKRIRGANRVTYTFIAKAREDGDRFRVRFRNARGHTLSRSAKLTIAGASRRSAPRITRQPASETVASGSTASFKTAASGNPSPTVRWEVSRNGGSSWTGIPGANSPSYSFPAQSSENGYRYRAVFTNAAGTAATTSAHLTVKVPTSSTPTITTQPAEQTVVVGRRAGFTAAASGSPAPTVQWQVSNDRGSSWSKVAGATSHTYSFTATSQQFYEYRAVFTNSAGTAISRAATLTVAQASTNWSGYATTGTAFKTVSASWTVPALTCAGTSSSYSAQWIGIDGDGDATVEQDGSEADCVKGRPYYGAWYEMYGDTAVSGGYEVPLSSTHYPVDPGDSLTASVSVSGSDWTLDISDATQNWSYSTTFAFSGAAQASAEWIMERPTIGSGRGQLPSLSDFGSTSFTGASATDAATSGSISSFPFVPLKMVDNAGRGLAVPGPLDATGASFDDSWFAGR